MNHDITALCPFLRVSSQMLFNESQSESPENTKNVSGGPSMQKTSVLLQRKRNKTEKGTLGICKSRDNIVSGYLLSKINSMRKVETITTETRSNKQKYGLFAH